ncbi:MAG: DUF4159 domain-containing protein [Phycisphaerae bacterium]|nr:DUF4159 domain-containing protein [Phycisphaerae bacterium]
MSRWMSPGPLSAAGVLVALCGLYAAAAAAALTPVDRAAERGVKFLLEQIGKDGRCKDEYNPSDPRYGGRTALCAYAFLAAEVHQEQPALKRALDWLAEAELVGTYAVAMRANAYAACKDERFIGLLRKDIQWLIRAAGPGGEYTYTSASGRKPERYDNSNSQFAVLGVLSGAQRGVKVPARYWRKVEQHWLDQQQTDGGWGYRIPPRSMRTETYGSITAAGLATLYACFDAINRRRFIRCTDQPEQEQKSIRKAMGWLAGNYTAKVNPRKGVQWYHHWLFNLQRVGLASGRKFIGGHDWFADGAGQLVTWQHADGSWGYGTAGQRVPETALSVLFLVRGRRGVLAAKLQYAGMWNCRPHDLANWARHVSFTFERPVTWQIVGPESEVADLHDAPILYISGAGACQLDDEQIRKIRTFVHQGGTILSEAAGNSGVFTLDMQKNYRRLFPDYPLKRLDDEHSIYSLYYSPKDIRGLSGVSNGARLLAVHSPRELSLGLQLGPRKTYKGVFDLLSNVYLMTTDMGQLARRGTRARPAAEPFTPRAVLRVARLKYDGNYDPEPLAWRQLAVWMGNNCRIKLLATGPMDITELDANRWPVAAMTGTGDFVLSEDETDAMRKYFAAGGTLILDAAGGSEAFTRSVEKQITVLVSAGRRRDVAGYVVLRGPAKIKRVYYRGSLSAALGGDRNVPHVRGVIADDRLVVIYSPFDLTVGMTGYEGYALLGYKPQSALAVMTNLLCLGAGVLSPKPPVATQPVTQPASQPAPHGASTQPASQPTTQPARPLLSRPENPRSRRQACR